MAHFGGTGSVLVTGLSSVDHSNLSIRTVESSTPSPESQIAKVSVMMSPPLMIWAPPSPALKGTVV